MRSGGAGVGGAAFVLAAVLVAAPTYIASVGSAGLQLQFDERCAPRIGLVLPATPSGRAESVRRAAQQPLEGARGLAADVHTTFNHLPIAVEGIGDVQDRVRLLHRDGGTDAVEVVDGPIGAGAWVPAPWAAAVGVEPGATLRLYDGFERFEVPVAATYVDISGLLPPAAWCTQSELLAPSPLGDPPTPLVLLDDDSFAALPVPVVGQMVATTEIPVARDGLTPTIAADLAARFELAADRATSTAALADQGPLSFPTRSATDLPAVLDRAEGIRSLVRVNVRSVQLAGVLAGLTLALGAGLLSARRRQLELTTRAVRGEGPVRLAARLAVGSALPAVVGALAGGIAAHLAVRAAGPSADLGTVRGTVLGWSALAAAGTVVACAVAATGVLARLADARPARRPNRVLAAVPWELAAVPLVIVSWRRLLDVGGAQFVGSEATSVDALALAFPVLTASVAALVVLRPAAAVARRLRRVRPSADPVLLLATRRLAHDPASSAAVVAAVALAAATAVLGGALATSAERALADKARAFVGADVAATVPGTGVTLPPTLDGTATVTEEVRAESGSQRVIVLAVDPATFADGASATAGDLELVARLADADARRGPDDPVPAVVIGPLPDTTLTAGARGVIDLEPIATDDVFPTSRSTSTVVVVPAGSLHDVRPTTVVLARGDGSDVERALTEAGHRVTAVHTVADTIAGSSLSAVRWAYAALQALGAVVVAVLVGVQLARGASKVRLRQLAEVFTHAMGLGRRRAVLAEVVEQGLPLVVGLAIGIGVAVVAAAVAAPELDSAAILPPRASLVLPASSVLGVVAVAAVALTLVVWGARRQAARARSAVVLRG